MSPSLVGRPGGQTEAGGVEVGAAVKAVGDEPYTYDTSLEGLIQKVGESLDHARAGGSDSVRE